MEAEKRKLLLNWCDAHGDLKASMESQNPEDLAVVGAGKGWTYITFFPRGTSAKETLYDINGILSLARHNSYYLPREVVAQHNKIVVTAYPEGTPHTSPLAELYRLVATFASRYDDTRLYPSHEFYGKFGGIYERPEKGRVLAVYSRSDDALLAIYESLEKLMAGIQAEGLRFDLRFSNGLSAMPRMLHGFDDPEYRRSGARYYRIEDPARFTILLNQALQDHEMYRFDDRVEAA